jgi:putative heme-binding domain-containing protein
VRVHAQRVLADRKELPDRLRALVVAGLKDADAFVQRAAVEALATHPSPDNFRPLLDLRHAVPKADTHLLHAVRMALRDQLRNPEHWAKLPRSPWSAEDGRAVADVAPGAPSPAAAAFLLKHLQAVPEPNDRRVRFVHFIARHGAAETAPALLAFAQADQPADLRHQAALFRAIQQGTQERGGKLEISARRWGEAVIGKMLAHTDAGTVQSAIELAGSLQLLGVQDTLVTILSARDRPDGQRSAAVNALTAMNPKGHIALLGRILADGSEPFVVQDQAAQALARVNQPPARAELLRSLPAAPARLQTSIALGLASSAEGAEQLLQAVAAGKASARLLQERPVQARLAATKLPGLNERIAQLTQGLPPADQRFQELIRQRRAGFTSAKPDVALGFKVFEKHCAACHQVGNKGTKIGPQLDGVGIRGVDRLLEDILDPNRNVDQAFRATSLALKNGQLVSGLLLKEEGEVLVLADAQGKELRVPKANVEERAVSPLSPMPANLVEQIPEADFYHLLAYLLAQRQAPKGETK